MQLTGLTQEEFNDLRPGDLVGFKHKEETIGLVTRTRCIPVYRHRASSPECSAFAGSRYEAYTEITIDWRDNDGAFIGMYASDDNQSLAQLRIIVKAKNNENNK